MDSQRKFLILGAGSMGKRRVRCLQAHHIRADAIRVVDQREDRLSECQSLYGVHGFKTFDAGMNWNPDVVIVSLPSKLHMAHCLAAARAKKDFWCEIALSHTLDGVNELYSLVQQHGLIAALGINNPFHYGLQAAKDWLQQSEFGKPLTYQITFGNYLPNWHPWEDYRDFYDKTQIMGVIAQELGTLYTLLDTRLSDVYAQMHHLSTLDIPGPDTVRVIANTDAGAHVTLNIDLLQDVQQYAYRIVGENGVIEVDFFPQTVARRYLNASGRYEVVLPPKGYQFEQCYLDEFGVFLQRLEDRADWYHPLQDGIHIMHVLQAIDESNRTGQKITLSTN